MSKLAPVGPAARRLANGARCCTAGHPGSVLIVGHGSRVRAANREFERLVALVRQRNPKLAVARAYIELARPLLSSALAALARRHREVLVVPCFLFAAGHVKNDIPLALAAVRRRFPRVRFRAARNLGVHPAMVEIAVERARSAFDPPNGSGKRTAVVVVGRGTSDPEANGDFFKLVRLFSEGRDFAWVVPSFIGITRPLFPEAIEMAARLRPDHIVVVPYMLFGGRLVAQLGRELAEFSSRYPQIDTHLARHLGPHEGLAALLEERMREALDGSEPLACDNCKYRVPIAGRERNAVL